jgi:prepilin-type N-terminal cleavage/methylation domain-containing protein
MSSFYKQKHCSGFTLIELVITITIAAILIAIVVPSFNSIIESSKERATRDALISAIYTAREQAISKRVKVYLCPTSDGATCSETTSWGSQWRVYQDGETLAHHTSKTDLILSDEKVITFSATGHSTANTFKICSNTDQSNVYELSLNRMGRVNYISASGDCE